MAGGRPSVYTPELADRICAALAAGESLRTVCKAEDLPCAATVFSWMRTIPEFLEQYTRAKEESADAMVDEMMDIADNQCEQPLIVDDVPLTVNGEMVMVKDMVSVNHAKLRIETRKWCASKLKPKKYGDKLTNEHTGPNGGPVESNLTINFKPVSRG